MCAAEPEQGASSGRRLSSVLEEVVALCQKPETTYGGLVDHLSDKGVLLFILIFSLPFLVSAPGLSIPFGIIIFAEAVSDLCGTKLYVPAWIRRKSVPQAAPAVLRAVGRIFKVLERFSRERGRHFLELPYTRKANMAVIAFAALVLALPLPPGTNFPPALAIVFAAIGMLEWDLFFVLLGWAAALITTVMCWMLFYLTIRGAEALF